MRSFFIEIISTRQSFASVSDLDGKIGAITTETANYIKSLDNYTRTDDKQFGRKTVPQHLNNKQPWVFEHIVFSIWHSGGQFETGQLLETCSEGLERDAFLLQPTQNLLLTLFSVGEIQLLDLGARLQNSAHLNNRADLSALDIQLLKHRHLQDCVQEQLPWKPISMVDVEYLDTVQSDVLIAE